MSRRIGIIAAVLVALSLTTAAGQDDVPDLTITATPSTGVAHAETGCPVALTASTGWTATRIVPDHVGESCTPAGGGLGWRHANDGDAGRRIVLIVEGRHTSGETRRAAVELTMADD